MSATPPAEETELDERERLELEKLREELRQLKKEPRSWFTRNVLQLLAAAVISGAAGLVLSAVEDRRQSEIRRDVLTKYLESENKEVGKRVQILDFVEKVLDDEKLDRWVRSERAALKETRARLEERIAREKEEVGLRGIRLDATLRRLEDALISDPAVDVELQALQQDLWLLDSSERRLRVHEERGDAKAEKRPNPAPAAEPLD